MTDLRESPIHSSFEIAAVKPRLAREAVILAGGKGVRLRPYTTLIPKPLVPIGDYSILEIVLRQLADQGFTKATLAIGHLGQLIRAYVGDGSQWGIEVEYIHEETPLGTIGPVVAALQGKPEHFLIAGALLFFDKSALNEPHERMKPEQGFHTHVNRHGQVVATPGMTQLMGQHCL